MIGDRNVVGDSSMNTSRYRHAAAQLADGRVLVTGGTSDGGADTSSAEIYTPSPPSHRRPRPHRNGHADGNSHRNGYAHGNGHRNGYSDGNGYGNVYSTAQHATATATATATPTATATATRHRYRRHLGTPKIGPPKTVEECKNKAVERNSTRRGIQKSGRLYSVCKRPLTRPVDQASAEGAS
jgi:hypothetical protein